MAMEWLKGLVAPVAQFSPTGQPMQGPPPGYGAPPPGAYGAPPPGAYGAPAGGPPAGGWDPSAAAASAGAPAPAYGTPTYGAGMPGVDPSASYGAGMSGVGPNAWGAPPPAGAQAAHPGGGDARVARLEVRCEELRRDLESVALFAQTLLALLEDKKVLTQQDFQETRRKLDLMDGHLDDRIGKSAG